MLPYITLGDRLIPMYGVCMMVGILISSYIAFVRTKQANGDSNSLIIIAACAIGCGLFGAKLLYIAVTYGVVNSLSQMLAGNFSFLLEGGQVFYGGLIGGIVGAVLGAWFTHDDLALYCDAIVPCIPLGHAFGRLGCFFAGCCYGMPYEGFGSLSFPAVGINYQTFPVQLLEMAINIGIFVYLIFYTHKDHKRYHVLYRYLLVYAVSRFALEFMRGDLVRGISNGQSTSQWISIGLFFMSILLMLPRTKKEKRRM